MTQMIKAETIGKVLEQAAELKGNDTLYIYQGEKISFREVNERADRVASGLLRLGFSRGDRLGIIGLVQPEWLYLYFAAAKIGLTVTALSVRYRDTELEYMLNQSESRGVASLKEFFGMDYGSFFDGFREKVPSVKEFIFIGGAGFAGSRSFGELLKSEIDTAALDKAKNAVRPDDLMIIIYTSGTTGKPKGAAISHKSQLASARAQAEHSRFKPDDLLLLALPLNHVGGITCGILSTLLGTVPSVLIPVPDMNEMAKLWGEHRPTVFGGVPTLYTLLFMTESFRAVDRSGLRIAISGGSNAEPALLKQMYEHFPNARVMNLYGLSESSGALVLSPWDSDFDKTVRSIGKPVGDFRAKAVDAGGKELPPGETGELFFKGDAVCRGYFRMPEETAESFDSDGWLHTGDMGYIDNEGYIVLMGRKKEMYIQGGFNVYPVEVENLLGRHPAVAMVAGIGVPDPVLGEVGRYYIVLRPGTTATKEEVISYCREHLADYKVPRQVVFTDALPMTPLGKIMKSRLKDDFMKSQGNASA
jgi:fatty-acyl-CoA synthase